MQSGTKRKTPSWLSASPQPPSQSSGASAGPSSVNVKDEPGDASGDVKRSKNGGSSSSGRPFFSASHGMYNDVRTAAIDLFHQLKKATTMSYHDAYFRVQETSPGLDANAALELLKGMDRVEFREVNEVFMYIPELTLNNITEIRSHIRVHSTQTSGVPVRTLREAMPGGVGPLAELEQKGDILIMRALTGPFKDIPLPRLGRKNINGLKINEGGNARWKTVFWDHEKEKGLAGKKVDEEFIFAWADVPMAENDDVSKLLAEQELTANSAVTTTTKIVPIGPAKKKKKTTRALKITNTHMKEQGIDFSKDYERPT
ncbi:transcription initiation factor TFIIE subunit beta [Kwoniella heveanensis CBS 569]|nr:transcription initiation factor TFIIE subunit beta [Kwoniella heveanensis CBS 569]